MSINGIGSYQLSAAALYSGQSANPVQSDGDMDRSRTSAPTNTRDSLFTSTITQTLFQIGVTPTAANVATGAAPTNTQQQALSAFVQNLLGALQDSGAPVAGMGGATSGPRKDGRNTVPSPLSTSGSGSSLDTSLQSLAQQLASGTGGSGDSLAGLQQSFQDLVATQGGANDASLGDFLQALSQNLQDIPPAGSLISTTA